MHGIQNEFQNPAELHEVALPAKVVSAAVTLTPAELYVLFDASGTYTITLPPAALCRGRWFSARATAGGGSVTFASNAGDAKDIGTLLGDTATAAGDVVEARSNGDYWVPVYEITT